MAMNMAQQALAIDAMLPALGQIAQDLKVTDPNQRQLVVGVFLIAAGLGALIPGALADRYGRRPVLLGSLALYFALMVTWSISTAAASGGSLGEMALASGTSLGLALLCLAVLAVIGRALAKAAVYTITNRRVVLRVGVALPMTMNIPLGKIANAALKTYRDGSGDIPLRVLHRPAAGGLLPPGLAAPQNGAHPGQDLPPGDGFVDLVIRAAFQVDDPLDRVGSAGQDDDGNARDGADAPQHRGAGHAAHALLQQDEMRRIALQPALHIARIRYRADLVSVGCEVVGEGGGIIAVVIHQKNALAHGRPCGREWVTALGPRPGDAPALRKAPDMLLLRRGSGIFAELRLQAGRGALPGQDLPRDLAAIL
eukprot:gene46494-56932_t